uniref:5-demethoxyubiquinone hydroxylase, mitochondrial n=1 Tax=Ascaris lumbricoides TaxID=6252 RepID=A0A0M3HUE8_ASCLU
MYRSLVRLSQAKGARQKLIEKVVRVDHAGELGADRIYAGQMAVLSNSSLSSVVRHMWDEEREHLRAMERLLSKHNVPHSKFTPLFSAAGFALGAGTALLGSKPAMACTIAVEELITRHYNDQIKELVDDDPETHKDLLEAIKAYKLALKCLLKRLRDEEAEHHQMGIDHDGLEAPAYNALKWIIQSGCRAAIWLAERI